MEYSEETGIEKKHAHCHSAAKRWSQDSKHGSSQGLHL